MEYYMAMKKNELPLRAMITGESHRSNDEWKEPITKINICDFVYVKF